MAQPATNPKIEELRFRLKTDAKSRLFYPLAEELRKVGAHAEAEQVLRAGIEHHPTYLSAFVSLGRVLKEMGKNEEAVPVLSKALQIDRENVVAARLLADTYLALGEKVEAIKKFKLVHALMPKDEEIEAIVARLELELNPAPAPSVESAEAMPGAAAPRAPVEEARVPAAEDPPFGVEAHDLAEPLSAVPAVDESPFEAPAAEASANESVAPGEHPFGDAAPVPDEPPFDATESSVGGWERSEEPEPTAASSTEVSDTPSPFAEPAGYGVDAFEVEHPAGMSIISEPSPWIEDDELPLPAATSVAHEPAVPAEESPWESEQSPAPAAAREESPWEQPSAAPSPWDEPVKHESLFASEPMPAPVDEPAPEPVGEPSWSTADAPVQEAAPAWEEQLTHPAEEAHPQSAEPSWQTEPTHAQEQLESLAQPWSEPDGADVFGSAVAEESFPDPHSEEPTEPSADEITDTTIMGDLYARQGLVDDARHVYERILQRDPANHAVREKLEALAPGVAASPASAADPSRHRLEKVARLEKWLARLRQENGDV